MLHFDVSFIFILVWISKIEERRKKNFLLNIPQQALPIDLSSWFRNWISLTIYLKICTQKINHKHTAPTTKYTIFTLGLFLFFLPFFTVWWFLFYFFFNDHSLRSPRFSLVTFTVQFTCLTSICATTNDTIIGQYFRIQSGN